VQAYYQELDASGIIGGGGWLKMKAPTRWNLMEGLLKSHIDCIEGICQVIFSHIKWDISDETTTRDIVKNILKHLPDLTHLKSASVSMQKRMASLKECQFHCGLLATFAKIVLEKLEMILLLQLRFLLVHHFRLLYLIISKLLYFSLSLLTGLNQINLN
jgi:hypothetical protein